MMKRKILGVLIPCLLLASLSTNLQAFTALAEETADTAVTTPAESTEESTPETTPETLPETSPETTPETPPETLPETTPETEDLDPMPNHSVALEAPEGLRAGETVTFTFLCKGDNVRGLQGSLTYDPTLLTYEEGQSHSLLDSWNFNFSNENGTLKYLGYCTESVGFSGKTALFSVTFRIAEEAETDAPLAFILSDALAYNGADLTFTGGSLNTAVTRPLSNECTLVALSVEDGALNPAFSPAVTNYTVSLPYSVQQANISATACENASLEFSNPSLLVGENTATVTVIAESGIQQVYTLTITRATDPDYVPSSDNRIVSVALSQGLLFPAFSPDVLDYSIYLVKGQTVTLAPTPADKAVAEQLIIPGDVNDALYTLLCTAENGTVRTYNIRTILLETPEELAEIEKQNAEDPKRDMFTIGLMSFGAFTVFFLGFVISYLIFGRRKKQTPPSAPSPENDAPTDAKQSDETEDRKAATAEKQEQADEKPKEEAKAVPAPKQETKDSKKSQSTPKQETKDSKKPQSAPKQEMKDSKQPQSASKQETKDSKQTQSASKQEKKSSPAKDSSGKNQNSSSNKKASSNQKHSSGGSHKNKKKRKH